MRNYGLACVCFWIRFRRNYSSSESSVDLTPAVGLAEWISLSSLTILHLQNFGHDDSRSHHFVGSKVSQTSSAPEGAHSGHCTGDHGVDAANVGHCDASPLRADVAGRHASVRRPHHLFECALVVV